MAGFAAKLKVLIVDSSAIAARLADMLGESDVVEIIGLVASSADARKLLERCDPVAIVLDSRVIDRDGLALIRELHESRSPHLIIVLMSQAEPALAEACTAAGASYVLKKHDDFERMVELVRDWHLHWRQGL